MFCAQMNKAYEIIFEGIVFLKHRGNEDEGEERGKEERELIND